METVGSKALCTVGGTNVEFLVLFRPVSMLDGAANGLIAVSSQGILATEILQLRFKVVD